MDWNAICQATKDTPYFYWLWMSKHVSGCFGMGKMMRRWKFWDHSHCPCCHTPIEDKAHLMTCLNEEAVAEWEHNILSLELWLEQTNTMLEIADCLLAALHARRLDYNFTSHCDKALALWGSHHSDSYRMAPPNGREDCTGMGSAATTILQMH